MNLDRRRFLQALAAAGVAVAAPAAVATAVAPPRVTAADIRPALRLIWSYDVHWDAYALYVRIKGTDERQGFYAERIPCGVTGLEPTEEQKAAFLDRAAHAAVRWLHG